MATKSNRCAPCGFTVLKQNFNGPGECIHKGCGGYMTLYVTLSTYEADNNGLADLETTRIRVQIGEALKTFVIAIRLANPSSSPVLKNVYVEDYEEVWAAIEAHRNEYAVYGFVSHEPVA